MDDRETLAESGPGWVAQALAQSGERTFHEVEGAAVETLAWGRRGDPGLILVHGFGASADWWAFTAPFLASGRRVVAISFSGGGGSSWRDSYTIDLYKREVLEGARSAGAFDGGTATLAAHSFGATVGSRLAVELGNQVAGFIVIDRPIVQAKTPPFVRSQARPRTRFSTEAEAISRFQTFPGVMKAEPAVMDYMARAAICRVDEGGETFWSRRYDPDYRLKLTERQSSIADELRSMVCRKGFIRGERSDLFTPEEAREAGELGMHVLTVPDAGHHLMLEAPLVLGKALDAMIRTFGQG